MSGRESREAKSEEPVVRWGRSVKETLREKVDGKGAKAGLGGKTHFDRWNVTRDKEERDALPPAEVKKFLAYVRGKLDQRMGDKSFDEVRALGPARKKVEIAREKLEAAAMAVNSTELGQKHKEWRTSLPTSNASVVALMNTPEFRAFEVAERDLGAVQGSLEVAENAAKRLGKDFAKRERDYGNLQKKVNYFSFLENGGNPKLYPDEKNRELWKSLWNDVLESGLIGGITELNLDDAVFNGGVAASEATETRPAPVVPVKIEGADRETSTPEDVVSAEGDHPNDETRTEVVDSRESSPSEAELKVEEVTNLFLEAGGTFTPTSEQEAQILALRQTELAGARETGKTVMERFKDIEKIEAELIAAATAYVADPEDVEKKATLVEISAQLEEANNALQQELGNGMMDKGRGYTLEHDATGTTAKDGEVVDWSKVDFGTLPTEDAGGAKPAGAEKGGRPPRTPEEDAKRTELLSQIHTLHLQMEQLLQTNDAIASKYIKKGHHGAPMDATHPLTARGTIYIGEVQLRYAKLGVKLDAMAAELKEKFGDIWPKTVDQKMMVLDKSGAMPDILHRAENRGLRQYVRYMPPKEFERLVAKALAKRDKLKAVKGSLAKGATKAEATVVAETDVEKDEREFSERIDKTMEGFTNGKPEGRGGKEGKANFREMLGWISAKYEKNTGKAAEVYAKAVLDNIESGGASYRSKAVELKSDVLALIATEGSIEKGLLRATKELPKIMRESNKLARKSVGEDMYSREDIREAQKLTNYVKRFPVF